MQSTAEQIYSFSLDNKLITMEMAFKTSSWDKVDKASRIREIVQYHASPVGYCSELNITSKLEL